MKLIKIYKQVSIENDSSSFIKISYKLLILTTVTTFVTFLNGFIPIIVLNFNTNDDLVYVFYLSFYAQTIDHYANCIFVILSFKYFNRLYFILLSCMDRLCGKCWFRMLGNDRTKTLELAQLNAMATLPRLGVSSSTKPLKLNDNISMQIVPTSPESKC